MCCCLPAEKVTAGLDQICRRARGGFHRLLSGLRTYLYKFCSEDFSKGSCLAGLAFLDCLIVQGRDWSFSG